MYIDPSQNTRIFMKVQLCTLSINDFSDQNVACKAGLLKICCAFLGQAGLNKCFLSHAWLKPPGGTRNRRKKTLDIALYRESAPHPIFLILVYLPARLMNVYK